MSDYYPPPEKALPLFRTSDPQPSQDAGRKAARSGLVSDHERRILAALAVGPGNKDEIAARCGLTEQQVARRRAGLERKGRVVLTGQMRRTSSGSMAEVWRIKELNHGR